MSTQTLDVTHSAATPADGWLAGDSRRLSGRVAFYLQASIVVFFLASSSAPTPLYAVYQAQWGFSPITTTVVFGIYALAVLAALLTVGSLSDHIGRRPVLLAALALQSVTMLIFATATGVPELLIARVLQGLTIGAAVGALGAGMIDLHKSKGTIANSVGPLLGTAFGAIGSSLLVQYLPDPTHLVYLVLLSIFVAQAVGVLLMPESSSTRPGALASLRPQFALPKAARGPFLVAAPALVAVWALIGFYGSLSPTLVRLLVGSHSFVIGGLALCALAASGGVAVLVLHAAAPRALMVLGTSALLVGVGVTLLAITETWTIAFFVGTAIAGVGFGSAFQGAIRSVLPLAAPHERSGVLSLLFVVSYLAFGVPAVVAGYLVVQSGDVLATAREYGLAVMVLAVLALVGVARPARQQVAEPRTPKVLPCALSASDESATADPSLAEAC